MSPAVSQVSSISIKQEMGMGKMQQVETMERKAMLEPRSAPSAHGDPTPLVPQGKGGRGGRCSPPTAQWSPGRRGGEPRD